MSDTNPKETKIDEELLEKVNQKALQNQFFTPDNVYIELELFKDFPLGAVYTDLIYLQNDEAKFRETQKTILNFTTEYQKRQYETVEPYFDKIGYNDASIDVLINRSDLHDLIFALAPAGRFFNTLIQHMIRNQNHSKPANKYIKKSIDTKQYVLEAMDITYRINTFPLTLSTRTMEAMGKEFGESFGVNIVFMNKDPSTFDKTDWKEWMKDIDCYYLDSLGRFQRSSFVIERQGALDFMGRYFFARKRFERSVIDIMRFEEFDQQIQWASSQLAIFCDFEWLQNNELRLTEEAEDVPMNEEATDAPDKDSETVS